MARTKNSVSLIGIVGKDAEMRQTQQGAHYAHISLATSMGGYKKKDGTDVPEVTQWHRVVAWNSLADFAGKYIKKGMKVAVDGMITYNTYKNQQGVDVNTTDIIASDIVLMTMPQGQQQQAGGGYQQQPQQQAQPVQQVNNNYQQGGYQPFPPPSGDDLPF